MTDQTPASLARALLDLAEKATPGPWYEPHLGDPSLKCECRHVCCDGYAGAVASVSVSNGLYVGDGGNDAPPYGEAVANGRFIAMSREAAPTIARAYLDIAALLTKIETWLVKADVREERGDDGCDYLNEDGFSDAAILLDEIQAALNPPQES